MENEDSPKRRHPLFPQEFASPTQVEAILLAMECETDLKKEEEYILLLVNLSMKDRGAKLSD